MSIATKKVSKQPLDGKMAWDAIIKYGGIGKAKLHLPINTQTDRHYSNMRVCRAAYEWALENPNLAKPDWEFEARRVGVIPSAEEWKAFLQQKAHVAYYYDVVRFEKYMEKVESWFSVGEGGKLVWSKEG